MFVKKLTNLAADNTKAVPLDAVRRLGVYMRRIRQLKAAGFDTISSEQIVAPYRISPAQFRKDLSYFGKFGKSGVGYNVDVLGDGIRRVIGTDRVWPVALIGVGELGTALLRYPGFLDSNFKMAAAFEADPAKIGRVCNGVRISDIRDLKKIVAKNGIRVAMVSTFGNQGLGAVECTNCGQCVIVCPTGALVEKSSVKQVWNAINDEKKTVVVQTAPAVRVAIGEEFGLPAGASWTGKMVAGLRALGFDKVFDTDFSADLTIMEEGNELLKRIKEGGTLPMITS